MSNYTGNANKVISSQYLYNMLQQLKTKYIDSKVEAVSGYALSQNDLTDQLKSSYDSAYTQSHTHSNGTILDGITTEKIASWDSAATLSIDYESTALDLTSLT